MSLSSIPESEKFAKVDTLRSTGKIANIKGEVPGDKAKKGETIGFEVEARDATHKRKIKLEKKFAEGGEGSVFTTNVKGYVAKIYKPDKITEDRQAKLKIMVEKSVSCMGICFPVALIQNTAGETVGYLMPEARGHELGKSVFVPELLMEKFPEWTRKETIQLCLTILHKIKYLNDRRVIMGDINPANILVVSPDEVYFVDCDSYQIEGYACTVGIAPYTPPEVQGQEYKTFLRTKEMENFAIATLLFMIMLPGKPPYSVQGGESPAKNILNGDFPYPCEGEYDDKAPAGKWGFIWSHMLYRAKLAFFDVFKKGRPCFSPSNRPYPDSWISLFNSYLQHADVLLRNDPMAMDIFPTRNKMRKCKTEGCENRILPDATSPLCDSCREKYNESKRQALYAVYKTKQCRNPKCSNTITILKKDQTRVEPDYCSACWQNVACANCGFEIAKWMADENGGLCRRCKTNLQARSTSTVTKIQSSMKSKTTGFSAPQNVQSKIRGRKQVQQYNHGSADRQHSEGDSNKASRENSSSPVLAAIIISVPAFICLIAYFIQNA